jgi:integrase
LTTVLRDIFTLSSVLSRVVRLGKLTDDPIRRVDKPRIDRRPKARFLDEQEESRLRAALHARDAEMREARESANAWRQKRKKQLLPSLPHFGDHLTPAVLLSMNTGLRRGELLALGWESIDFNRRILTVEGGTAKSRQTRRLESGGGTRIFRDPQNSVDHMRLSLCQGWVPYIINISLPQTANGRFTAGISGSSLTGFGRLEPLADAAVAHRLVTTRRGL